MFAFLLCILAVAVTGGTIAGSADYFGVSVIYVILATLLVSYLYYFVTKREALSFGTAEKALVAFEGWGLFYVILSLAGVNRWIQVDLSYDFSFIPRQAVYFFVLPAAILFREDFYIKGMEWFLKRYGELLFWVLYLAEIFFFHTFVLTVLTQVFLCWLSLRLDTNQRWRRWIRIAALVFTPMYDGGMTTILIVRMIFLAICVVPRSWQRITCYLMAAVILVMVISCFIFPPIVDDYFFPDHNMVWRTRTWRDSISILSKTNLLGVGYGTSYQSEAYIQESFLRNEYQYRERDGYTEEERKFVTAPHNSYISVAVRTGFIGIFLFILFLGMLFYDLIRYRTLPSKSSCFALFSSAVIITFNVGLESPSYLLTFVFCMGVCMRESKKLKIQNQMLRENCEAA